MSSMQPDMQLELFNVPHQTPIRRNITAIGNLQLRHDHVVLLLIAVLIGCSVVFAMGVERGKSVAQAAGLFLSPQGVAAKAVQVPQQTTVKRAETSADQQASAKAPPAKSSPVPVGPRAVPDKRVAPSAPVKVAADERSRFAIQVVSYRQPRLAQRELQRLQQRGEQAFLIMKQDKVVVFVGPFPTKSHASSKLVRLRQQYQDCFLRSL